MSPPDLEGGGAADVSKRLVLIWAPCAQRKNLQFVANHQISGDPGALLPARDSGLKPTDPQRRHTRQLEPFQWSETLDEDQHLLHFLLKHFLEVLVSAHKPRKDLRR